MTVDLCITADLLHRRDLKPPFLSTTTILPITAFAAAVTPKVQLIGLFHSVCWVWLHLLQFNVSNQCLSIEEDSLNKSDRPLPSNRLTLQSAKILRWILLPLCLAQSSWFSPMMFWVSSVLSAAFILYNELGGHAIHWSSRNIMNAFGLSLFEAGAALAISQDPTQLTPLASLGICISGLVYLTTFHAQDFKDIHGDILVGRSTLPILWPDIARISMFIGMMAWSVILSLFWQLDLATSVAFAVMGSFTGYRFTKRTKVVEDQISFYWYNGWVSFVHILPAYYRYFYM